MPARRIVSLIPSITEILFAIGAGDRVVGCTIYCTQPPEGVATKTRIGGEKNPKLELIRDLGADLVIANVEENVREHVETLRAWGIAVHVTYPADRRRRHPAGGRAGRRCSRRGRRRASSRRPCGRATSDVRAAAAGRRPRRVFCPIWRKPYMTINADTYIHDMLAVSGGTNVFGGAAKRYPEVTLEEVAATDAEVILLPDEPYRFRQVHQADFAPYPDLPAVRDGRIHLVDGKLLSWYGPRIAQALEMLPPLLGLAAALRAFLPWRAFAARRLLRRGRRRGALSSRIISISTGMPAGSEPMPDGGARVPAVLAEHLHHQVGEAVDDLGLLAEALDRVHHAQHLDDPLHLVEAAQQPCAPSPAG